MHKTTDLKIISPVILLRLLDVFLGVGYLFSYFYAEPHWKLTHLLDLDNEAGLATWYSSIKFFCIAALATLFVNQQISRIDKFSWILVALPCLFLFFSMDEIVQIHESIGSQTDQLLPENDRQSTYFKHTGIWTFVIGVPFVFCFFLWCYFIRRYFPKNMISFKLFILGMAIFLTGALGIETLSNHYDLDSAEIIFCVAAEELMEMLGATIIFQSLYLILSEALGDWHNLVTHQPVK